MPPFTFILLIFLNFLQSNLSIKIPCKFILNDMNIFISGFDGDLRKFAVKVAKIVGQKQLREMGQSFMEAVFHVEFLDEIEKMKKRVKKYLMKENENFEEMVDKLNKLKLEKEKLNALKRLKNEWEAMGNIPQENLCEIPLEGRIELVNELFWMNELANRFLDKIKTELQIRVPLKYFNNFEEIILKNGQKLEEIFERIFEENKNEGLQQIRQIISKIKEELRNESEKKNFSEKALKWEKKLPLMCKKNLAKLNAELEDENPLLEKVDLNMPEDDEELPEGIEEIIDHHKRIWLLIEDAVDEELSNFIENNSFFQSKQKKYAKFRQFQLLTNACSQMFHRIPILWGNYSRQEENYNLADIRYLSEYIHQKLVEINKGPQIEISKLKSKNELPRELLIDGRKGEEEKIILVAENLLFISGQLEKVHKIEEAISRVNAWEGRQKIIRMIERKTVPQNVGFFLYEKYLELHRKEKMKRKLENTKGNPKKLLRHLTMKMESENSSKDGNNVQMQMKTWPQIGQINETGKEVKQLELNKTKLEIEENTKIEKGERANTELEQKKEHGKEHQNQNASNKSGMSKNEAQFEHSKQPIMAIRQEIEAFSTSSKAKYPLKVEMPKSIVAHSKRTKTNKNAKLEEEIQKEEILWKMGDFEISKNRLSPKVENVPKIVEEKSKNIEKIGSEENGEKIVWKSEDKNEGGKAGENVPSSEQSEVILWNPTSSKDLNLNEKIGGETSMGQNAEIKQEKEIGLKMRNSEEMKQPIQKKIKLKNK